MSFPRVQLSTALFFVGLLILGFAWWNTLAHMVNLIWTVDVFAHGQLVPLISLALIWTRREGLLQQVELYLPGIVVILGSVVLWMLGQLLDAALFTHIALVSAVQGLVLLSFGKAIVHRLLFPLLFLYLMVPFGHAVIEPLQYLTAEFVIDLLGILGVPYTADGVLIELSSGLYEVAQACAGVKFLFTSLVTGVLLANLVFNSWRRRAMIVGVALLLPIAANIVRVLTILLIAESTDQSFAKDVDHIVYGWVFLSIVLFLLISFAYWVSDKPVESEPVGGGFGHCLPETVNCSPLAVLLIAVSLALVGVSPLIFPSEKTVELNDYQPEPQRLFAEAPAGYRLLTQATRLPKPFLSNVDTLKSAYLRRSANIFSAHVAIFNELGPAKRLFHNAHSVASKSWEPIVGRDRYIRTQCNGLQAREQIWARNGQLSITWTLRFAGSQSVASSFNEKIATLRHRLMGGPIEGKIISIASEIFGPIESEEGLENYRISFNDLLIKILSVTTIQGNNLCAA